MLALLGLGLVARRWIMEERFWDKSVKQKNIPKIREFMENTFSLWRRGNDMCLLSEPYFFDPRKLDCIATLSQIPLCSSIFTLVYHELAARTSSVFIEMVK
jgi:hypothetical protein